jgi:uncharacterized caspase-like protein
LVAVNLYSLKFTGALHMLRAAVIVLLIALSPTLARAEARIALLIGNQGYDRSVGILKNPYNDIAVVGDALAQQGFQVLPPIKDATRVAILGGVRDLVRRLNTAGVGAIGFIYYSGHGAAEKDTNINYLIPVDAQEPGTVAFWDASLKLDDILRLLDGARSAAKFIVFDACRSELQLPTKDTTKGLVPVAEQQGMFIAYASAPGHTASDMGDKSGPYAAALAAELAHPGLDHLNLFQNIKEAVLAATGGAQQPWESNGLGRRVYLTGQPPKPAAQDQLNDASREWSGVDKTSIAELETFLHRHGSSVQADYARARLSELRKAQAEITQQADNAAKKKADDEARTKAEAERKRLAMLQQREDEEKRAEAEAAQQAAKKKSEEEARAKAEADRQRLALLQRQEDDRKRAEAAATQPEADAAKKKSDDAERAKVAALPKIEKPAGVSQFDGHWSGTWTGDPGKKCDPPSSPMEFTIANGVVKGNMFTGRVSASGAIRGIGHAPKDGAPVRREGTLHGNSGSGRTSRITDDKCTGRFTVRRN